MKQLKPSQELPQDIITKLKNIVREKDPVSYRRKVGAILGLTEINPNEKSLIYLGGFTNGEGSVNASIKKSPGSKFGVTIDPEFSLTQHANGASMLFYALCYFHTGRIQHKSQRSATLIYRISSRATISEKIKPFFTNYMNKYCPESLRQRYNNFFRLLDCFERGDHLSIGPFEKNILPLWEVLRVQDNQKTVFRTTADVMVYVREYLIRKNEMF